MYVKNEIWKERGKMREKKQLNRIVERQRCSNERMNNRSVVLSVHVQIGQMLKNTTATPKLL